MAFEGKDTKRSVVMLTFPLTIADLDSAARFLLDRHPNGSTVKVEAADGAPFTNPIGLTLTVDGE